MTDYTAIPTRDNRAADEQRSDPMLPPGTRACQCPACEQYFTGATAFDMHRAGPRRDRRCFGVLEMSERGLERDPKGRWQRAFPDSAKRAA